MSNNENILILQILYILTNKNFNFQNIIHTNEFEEIYKLKLEQNLPQLHILWMETYVSLSAKENDDSESDFFYILFFFQRKILQL